MDLFDRAKQNLRTEGCSKLKRSVHMTSSGMNGFNIRTNAVSVKMKKSFGMCLQ